MNRLGTVKAWLVLALKQVSFITGYGNVTAANMAPFKKKISSVYDVSHVKKETLKINNGGNPAEKNMTCITMQLYHAN